MFSYDPLVVRFGTLEDMVLLTPLLRLLHRRWRRPCRVMGSGRWLGPLLDGRPDVQAVLTVSNLERPYWFDGTQHDAVQRLRMQPPGAVYVCDDPATVKVRRLLRHAGVLADQCRFANPDCPLRDGEHWIDRWQRFAEMTPPAFVPGNFRADARGPAKPWLVSNAGDRADLAEWLDRRGLADAKIILLQPGSGRARSRGGDDSSADAECWPSANWVALIHALLADPGDFSVIVCGAPPDTALPRDLASSVGSPRVQVVGRDLPLRRFMALCGHAHAMISVDSGRAQVAAASGCPLIVLYGSRQPARWCPRSASGSPVLHLGGPPARSRVDEVTLDEVLAAWRALRGSSPASASPERPGPRRGCSGQPVRNVPH
jgi:heptosyltransferase-2/heptosyltransferase-3